MCRHRVVPGGFQSHRTNGVRILDQRFARPVMSCAAALVLARWCRRNKSVKGFFLLSARPVERRRSCHRHASPTPPNDDAAELREMQDQSPVSSTNNSWLSYLPGMDEPSNALGLGVRVFERELDEMISAMKTGPSWLASAGSGLQDVLRRTPHSREKWEPPFLSSLSLNIDKVTELESKRGVPDSNPFVGAIFFTLCWGLDRLYEGRPIQKFWVLETIARIPYFSYISALHLYETLGWWRTPQLRGIHSAEEDNELHHLLIMESLGGNTQWFDRFCAQHAALVYYWLVVALFVVDPKLAYNFSLLVEEHAFVTYSQFVEENRDRLQAIPAPPVAVKYYLTGDLYHFDRFHTGREQAPLRRPPCDTLLDVFQNIRDDELEHVRTMRACQDWWAGDGPTPLPEAELELMGSREEWRQWAAKVNALAVHHSAGDSSPQCADACGDAQQHATQASGLEARK